MTFFFIIYAFCVSLVILPHWVENQKQFMNTKRRQGKKSHHTKLTNQQNELNEHRINDKTIENYSISNKRWENYSDHMTISLFVSHTGNNNNNKYINLIWKKSDRIKSNKGKQSGCFFLNENSRTHAHTQLQNSVIYLDKKHSKVPGFRLYCKKAQKKTIHIANWLIELEVKFGFTSHELTKTNSGKSLFFFAVYFDKRNWTIDK